MNDIQVKAKEKEKQMKEVKKKFCEHEKEHALTVQRVKEDILLKSDVEKISRIFQMLSDPNSLSIVMALMKGDMCVYHLTEVCDATQSNISHQLRILRDNNIVRARRLGQNVEYSLADEHIREMVDRGKVHLLCKVDGL